MSSNSLHAERHREPGRNQALGRLLLSRRDQESVFYRPCVNFNTALKDTAITLLNNFVQGCDTLPRRLNDKKMNAQMQRLYQAAELLLSKTGQSEVGRLLNESPQVLANWEKRGMSAAGVLSAAAAIGCDAIWLRDGVGRMRPGMTGLPAHEAVQLLLLYDQADELGRSQIMDAALAASKKVVVQPTRIAGNDQP